MTGGGEMETRWFDKYQDTVVVSPTIDGCCLIDLKMYKDKRGYVLPIFSLESPRVLQCSYSRTRPDAARDIDTWHVHKIQTDRFVVLTSCVIFGLSDGKRTERVMMGSPVPEILVIPPGIYHCYRPRYRDYIGVLNFPTEIYDPDDEGRIPFSELSVEHPW